MKKVQLLEIKMLNKILDEKGVDGLIKFLSSIDNACNEYQKALHKKYGEEETKNMFEW